jgi:membrane fusion protein (multidrug efflux system)
VQIDEGIATSGITVPVQAVQRTDAGTAAVYVINNEGRAVLQLVRAGRTLGNEVLIEDGLKPGYRVVVDGFQKFTPGTIVQAVVLNQGPAETVSN